LNYFNSQSWPFPNQLMMAFTAETEQRVLTIDQKEILEADWFNNSNLPQVPPKLSLSGQLIKEALNS
jgi:NAD+ diphosphatase